MKVIVAVQARMNSSRLPGKVMADLAGKPMIHRVWDACLGPWQRMVLTTMRREDDVLCDYLKDQGMDFRRGSEPDVLSRYAQVANSEKPHCLVRVCGDAPFLQASWIEAAVKANQAVFVPKALHAGSWIVWDEANRWAAPYDWEHAGAGWFEEKAMLMDLVTDPSYFSVNTPKDMEKARELWASRTG